MVVGVIRFMRTTGVIESDQAFVHTTGVVYYSEYNICPKIFVHDQEEMRFCAERKILSEKISPKQSRGGTIRNV